MGTTLDGLNLGKIRRDEGIAKAAENRRRQIAEGQLKLLKAILSNPSRAATTDEVTPAKFRRKKFADGGYWRGSIPLGLAKKGLITKGEVKLSCRPTRHAGYLATWVAMADDERLEAHARNLKRFIKSLPPTGAPAQLPLFPEN